MRRLQPGLIALALAAAGCGGVRREEATAPLPELVEIATGRRFEGRLPPGALAGVRVVYVGERHDRAADHAVQLEVIRRVLEDDPSLAIGMEMFQRPFQAALDAWVAGELDEEGLLAATEWRERWRMDFGLYRPILELARQHRLPVVALNARRELTRAISREGLEGLPPELAAELPELDTADAEHRAMVMEALAGHEGMDPARLERFYLAQLTWDESMAARVAEVLTGPDAPRRMVVLAGRMHVQRRLGIPRRAERRGAGPSLVILPLEEGELADAQGLCDWAYVVGPGGHG